MEKVLIWMKKENIISKGGPAGYLYNLRKYFLENNEKNFFFLEKNYFRKKGKIRREFCKLFHKIFIKNEKKRLEYKVLNELNYKNKLNKKELDKFSFIHFHVTKDLYECIDDLNEIKSKIILQSHSPQLSTIEELEDRGIINKLGPNIVKKFKQIDYIAFQRADYIIFPCVEAMDPYLKDEEMKRILENKKESLKFLLTGIEKQEIKEERDYFKEKFNIPLGSLVISYIGRHNEIKGYDFLKRIGEKILEKYQNVYFVIAGQESERIPKLSHDRWIECGWTKEGLNIMKNCDLFILPNRETYFDLIFLELLSQNTTILCSDTGGNKFFKKYNSEKIIYFSSENIDNVIDKFDSIYSKLKDLKKKEDNYKIYKEDFTLEKFGKSYINLIKELK